MIVSFCGIVYHSTANRRPGAPRLGWPGGCPTAPPMACPRHVAPPHPAVLAHVSRGAGRFSCAGPARGGAHVGKAVPCSLGGPREAVSGCLREAAFAALRASCIIPSMNSVQSLRAARPPLEGHIWGCLKKSTYSRYRWPCHSQYRSRHPVDRSGSGGSMCGTCGGAVVEGPNRPLEGHRASEACMAGWLLAGFYCSDRSLVFRFQQDQQNIHLAGSS